MHNRDELCSESGLNITGDVFDCGSDGVPGCEWRVYNDAKAFNLEVGFI